MQGVSGAFEKESDASCPPSTSRTGSKWFIFTSSTYTLLLRTVGGRMVLGYNSEAPCILSFVGIPGIIVFLPLFEWQQNIIISTNSMLLELDDGSRLHGFSPRYSCGEEDFDIPALSKLCNPPAARPLDRRL